MTGGRRRVGLVPTVSAVGLLVLLGMAPLVVRREDWLNLGVVFFLAVALAQSWNVIGGLAGQVNLGHAAFFGLGALVARQLWAAGTPIAAAMTAGAAVATTAGLALGLAAFRLRGAYFAIGTLALAEGLRLFVANTLSQVSTLPAAAIAGYQLGVRYYTAAGLALGTTLAVAWLAASRLGLAMEAVREDEEAAEASGVGGFQVKLAALACSTALVGLAGGVFAFYQISYYPQHPFNPTWTFDAVLITFIGGVGTIHGPVLGAVLFVLLRDYLAVRWADLHVLVFGALFVAIVLLLPGGLVEVGQRLRGRPGVAGRGRVVGRASSGSST